MNYLRPKFNHMLSGKAYSEGWERTFGSGSTSEPWATVELPLDNDKATGKLPGMSKHSPGPWRIEPDAYSGGAAWIKDAAGYAVVEAHRCEQPLDISPDDARLIAAAPELLDALKMAMELAWQARGGDSTAAMSEAYALIRRIEGEE